MRTGSHFGGVYGSGAPIELTGHFFTLPSNLPTTLVEPASLGCLSPHHFKMRHTPLRILRIAPIPLVIVTALLAIYAPPLPAQPAVYLPGAANTAGLGGAQFRTRVFIFAYGSQTPVVVNVLAATPGGLLTPASVGIPDDSLSYSSENILADLFHYTGGAALRFTVDPSSGGLALIVRAEVYTDGPFGEMSTPVPVLTSGDAVPPAYNPVFGQYNISLSIGTRSDSAHRMNVACSNFGPNSVSVDAYIYSTGGVLEWNHEFTLSPGQWSQAAVDGTGTPDGTGSPVFSNGVAHFYAYSSQGVASIEPVFCYAVIVNNASNDGTVVPATARGLPPIPIY